MAADVVSTKFSLKSTLDTELENARATLRGVEDSIKRVFGKDASELNTFQPRPPRRSLPEGRLVEEVPLEDGEIGVELTTTRSREDDKFHRRRGRDNDNYSSREDEPFDKRRRFVSETQGSSTKRSAPIVLASRLIKPGSDDREYGNGDLFNNGHGGPPRFSRDHGRGDMNQRLQSRVAPSGKEKSREEVLAEQRQDQSGRDRNRRMFGALLGTLHRFKQDESKLKEKEDKRAQIEAKLEEQAMQEKESVKKEKQKLIRDHKLKLTEIKKLEYKKHRLEQLEEWEEKTKHLKNFIRTESKPNIFFLPKVMNPITECRLDESKTFVEEMIANKRKTVLTELESYDEQNRRYWEHKDEHDTARVTTDPLDVNMEDELKALMKDVNFVNVDCVTTVLTDEHPKRKRIVSAASVGSQERAEEDDKEGAADAFEGIGSMEADGNSDAGKRKHEYDANEQEHDGY